MSAPELKPSLEEFRRLARRSNVIPVYANVLSDHITPVGLLASGWNTNPHCFLLESVEGGERMGRYSIVGFQPRGVFEQIGDATTFRALPGRNAEKLSGPMFTELRRALRSARCASVRGLPRFFGGAVGYAAYEVVHDLENIPRTNPDTLGWPTAVFFLADDLFVFDNTQQVLKVVSCARVGGKVSAEAAYAQARRRIAANLALIRRATPAFDRPVKSRQPFHFTTNVDKAGYMEMVREAKASIGQGDIIQVVLSRRNERQTTASPLNIYRTLRVVNPSPYMFVFKMGERAIIGSSPESLVRLEDGLAMTRPIAGTRRRGADAASDAKLQEELLKDPKERAEHIMLVDLGRNDLGRVCDYGSVAVPTFMTVEKYSHVMHIVSEVRGRLKAGKDAFDLLASCFPAGTLSGAPKIRAMQIIDELENMRRGPYGGALGYVSYSGNMDMAITIRTILWDRGRAVIQTGAGIVADSDPAEEFQETENKAAGMKESIRLAESGALFGDAS